MRLLVIVFFKNNVYKMTHIRCLFRVYDSLDIMTVFLRI